MHDIVEFFRGLFDSDQWPPRWKCGHWSDFHGWLYIISDLMIWLAYFLIPLIILNYFTSKKTIRFQRVYLLFAAFILLCGTTHFLDAVMFWVPMYRLNGLVRLITGIVSMLTVYHLIRILPQAVKMRTSLELETEIARREIVERDLAEANGRLAAFASIASHDLQEPLRKISTYSDMVFTQNQQHFDENTRLHIQKIKKSTARMQGLIRDVLALSVLTSDLTLQKINPGEAVLQAIDNLELMIADKKALIEISELPFINGNVPALTQVFSNLLNNALKFNNSLPHIWVSGQQAENTVTIRVSDNGIGLEPEHFEKIFRAFERVHAKSKYPGSGIGLAICRRIIELHHGSIAVESTPGNGTTFVLRFPAA